MLEMLDFLFQVAKFICVLCCYIVKSTKNLVFNVKIHDLVDKGQFSEKIIPFFKKLQPI